MTVRTPFAADMRAAAVTMLTAYGASTTPDLKLQVFRARPRTLWAPCAFVDRMSERVEERGINIRQRVVSVEVVVLHGLFDSGEAVDQRDAFVDGFMDWVSDNYHAAGANTLVSTTSIEDEPAYVPDWVLPENQRTYYASRITLEGFAGDT